MKFDKTKMIWIVSKYPNQLFFLVSNKVSLLEVVAFWGDSGKFTARFWQVFSLMSLKLNTAFLCHFSSRKNRCYHFKETPVNDNYSQFPKTSAFSIEIFSQFDSFSWQKSSAHIIEQMTEFLLNSSRFWMNVLKPWRIKKDWIFSRIHQNLAIFLNCQL